MIEDKNYKKLRIFVAAPSDVMAERDNAHAIAEELNRADNVADQLGLTLEVLDWRTHVAPFMGQPEGVILQQLPVEVWDIFIGILWLRFGKPTGEVDPHTGKEFVSGTEQEFTLAYHAWKQNDRPQILFYRCTRPVDLDRIDPEQFKNVKAFFADFDADKKHPGLYQSYQELQNFEQRVRRDLTKLLFKYKKLHCNTCNGTLTQSLHERFVLYQGNPRIIENVPAKVCQQCGERYFDTKTVEMLRKVDWNHNVQKQKIKMLIYDFSDLSRSKTRGKKNDNAKELQ